MAIKLDSKEMSSIYADFVAGKKEQKEFYVEFDNINNIDTLILLRVMGHEPDVKELADIAEMLLDGHKITFKKGDTDIKTYYYNKGEGNRLHLMFSDAPYLYDILQQAVYALLLKKLTPHLEGSN